MYGRFAVINVAEVSESEATGKTAAIFSDIKSTLRVPLVNLIFRVLATYPDYLQLAWQELKPNAQTVYFEQQSDEIRRYAVESTRSLGQSPQAPEPAAAALRVYHYINPKLLLAAGALRAATNGQQPRLQGLPIGQKRQLRPGVPSDSGPIDMISPEEVPLKVRAIFDDLQNTMQVPVINSDYRTLAQWPDYLDDAWAALRPVVQKPEYAAAELGLHQIVDESIVALPYRMTLNPHALRQSGLSEQDLDAIREILETFYDLLPGLVLNIAFLSVGVLGHEAIESPFPATTL